MALVVDLRKLIYLPKLPSLLLVMLSIGVINSATAEYRTTMTPYEIGISQVLRNKPREAIKSFSEAIRIKPDNAVAYCYRGACKLKLEDIEGARLDLDKSLQLDPKLPEAYYQKSLYLAEIGKNSDAISTITKGIIAAGKIVNPGWYQIRGSWYMEGGKLDLSLADFDEAIKRAPQELWPNYWRANILYKKGKYEEAILSLNRAATLTANNDTTKIYQLRANCYDKLGKHDLATKDRKTAESKVRGRWEDVLPLE